MGAWKNEETVIVIDAVMSGVEAGTIHRFDAVKEKIPGEFCTGYSTHSFSLIESVGISKALGEMPSSLIIYGIEGRNFAMGQGLSSEVEKAAEKAMNLIMEEIRKIRKETDSEVN
jgi:hydrogenase maturation protease